MDAANFCALSLVISTCLCLETKHEPFHPGGQVDQAFYQKQNMLTASLATFFLS